MLISSLSIKRPVLATVINALLLVIGAAALWRLPVRQFPDIDPPVISITTTYLGASAAVVENDVTKRIEEAIAGIEGVRLITAVSRDEAAQVDVEFTLGRNIDFAAADVRDQIGRIRKQLPPTVDEPILANAYFPGGRLADASSRRVATDWNADLDNLWRMSTDVCMPTPEKTWTETGFDAPPWKGAQLGDQKIDGVRIRPLLMAPIEVR